MIGGFRILRCRVTARKQQDVGSQIRRYRPLSLAHRLHKETQLPRGQILAADEIRQRLSVRCLHAARKPGKRAAEQVVPQFAGIQPGNIILVCGIVRIPLDRRIPVRLERLRNAAPTVQQLPRKEQRLAVCVSFRPRGKTVHRGRQRLAVLRTVSDVENGKQERHGGQFRIRENPLHGLVARLGDQNLAKQAVALGIK